MSPMMRSRRGSMRRYAPCNDLEPGARPDGAAARQAGGVATCAPQPQPQHYHHTTSTFQRPRAAHQRSDRPQTWLKHRALVVRPLPSESARCASRIALNNTKSDLGSFKALKARAGIPDAHKRRPQWGLVLPSRPCHVGGRPTSRVALQGPGAGAKRSDDSGRSAAPERTKIGKDVD
jgi:hypothetical protein